MSGVVQEEAENEEERLIACQKCGNNVRSDLVICDKCTYSGSLTRMQQTKVMLKPLLGIAICAIAAVFFCLTNVIVKYLSHVDTFRICSIRFAVIWLLASPTAMLRSGIESPFPKGKRLLLILRSVLGASNIIIHFYALQVSKQLKTNFEIMGLIMWSLVLVSKLVTTI
jgi:drug/metabolite transporter (DMT)-like permease